MSKMLFSTTYALRFSFSCIHSHTNSFNRCFRFGFSPKCSLLALLFNPVYLNLHNTNACTHTYGSMTLANENIVAEKSQSERLTLTRHKIIRMKKPKKKQTNKFEVCIARKTKLGVNVIVSPDSRPPWTHICYFTASVCSTSIHIHIQCSARIYFNGFKSTELESSWMN